MTLFLSPVVYTLMFVGYALSLGLFFTDFLKDNRVANRLGLALLGVVWVMETGFVVTRTIVHHDLPLFSASTATIFYSWLLLTVSLAVSIFSRIDYFTFFLNLLGFLFVVFDTLSHGAPLYAAPKQGSLLLLHIAIAFLSYLAFSVSCIFSILYLLEDSALRKKRYESGPFRRLPPLERLDVFAYRSALVGEPLLLIAIILGAVWYAMLTGHVLLMDAKPIVTFVLLVFYGLYLYLRGSGRINARRGAWMNLIWFGCVILNFLVIGAFASNFHRW